jgi:hypothetical protein
MYWSNLQARLDVYIYGNEYLLFRQEERVAEIKSWRRREFMMYAHDVHKLKLRDMIIATIDERRVVYNRKKKKKKSLHSTPNTNPHIVINNCT